MLLSELPVLSRQFSAVSSRPSALGHHLQPLYHGIEPGRDISRLRLQRRILATEIAELVRHAPVIGIDCPRAADGDGLQLGDGGLDPVESFGETRYH
jgi:hypothetical protein